MVRFLRTKISFIFHVLTSENEIDKPHIEVEVERQDRDAELCSYPDMDQPIPAKNLCDIICGTCITTNLFIIYHLECLMVFIKETSRIK